MATTLIGWKLSEVMARHRVPAKDLATFLGVSNNALSSLRTAETMPRIDGKRLGSLCDGITELSKLGDRVTPFDLLEVSQTESN